MRDLRHTHIRLILGLLVLAGVVVGVLIFNGSPEIEEPVVVEVPVEEPVAPPDPQIRLLGTSVEGRDIETYTFGTGEQHLLFVGGIHGGYEWNSVLLAYELIDYLTANPSAVPDALTVDVIPSANPDGVFKVLGVEGRFAATDVTVAKDATASGRFNANGVDLNRNFACKWQPESMWRGNVVSAGTAAFSEPEAQAIRTLVQETNPKAAVFFHSQSNAVYASECEFGVLPETRTVMNTYALATGYPAVDSFDAYEITGDAEGWLASIGVPAITVELSTHETVEWQRNLPGILALFDQFSSYAK